MGPIAVTASIVLWIIGAAALLRAKGHRIGTAKGASLLAGENHLGIVSLCRAEGFTPRGQRLIRYWALAHLLATILVAVAGVLYAFGVA